MSSNNIVNNIFTSLGIKNKGIGGLASGLDTDSLMEAMTMTTRAKIAKQQQQKQLLNWKMAAYRSTAKTISNVKNKFFSTSAGSSNMLLGSFYSTFKASSSSSKVSITSTTSSAPVDFSINKIHQLATSQSVSAAQSLAAKLEGGEIKLVNTDGTAVNFTGKTLSLTVDGATKTIKLDALQTIANGVANGDYDIEVTPGVFETDQAAVDAALQTTLQGLFDTAFGFAQNQEIELGGVSFGKFKDLTKAKYETISGTTITNSAWEVILQQAQDQARNVKTDITDGKLTISAPSSKIMVNSANTEKGVVPGLLGLSAGQSNRLDTNTLLRNIVGIGGELAGDTFEFKINGVTLSINANETLATLITRVNSSTANVRLSYSSINDTLTLTSKVTGAGNNLEMEDVTGNLLNKMFGAKGSDDILARQLTMPDGLVSLNGYASMTNEQKLAFVNSFGGTSFNMTVGGKTEAVSLKWSSIDGLSNQIAAGTAPTLEQLADVLNAGLTTAFGTADATRQGVYFTTSGGSLVATSYYDNVAFSMDNNKGSTAKDLLGALGFAAGNRTNAIDLKKPENLDLKLADIGVAAHTYKIKVGGIEHDFEVDADTTIADLQQKFTDAGLSLTVREDGRLTLHTGGSLLEDSDGGLLSNLFGVSSYKTAGEDYGNRMVAGQNAEIEVADGNGNVSLIVNANNTFDLFGARITLNGVTTDDDPIRLKIETNPDELVDKIQTFIDDYNTMIELLNTLIYEEAKSGYMPLSDEQKNQMSADEIEKWETEAKKGILKNDSTLRGIIDEMRSVFYKKIDSIGLAGYDLGITTKNVMDSSMLDNGKIELTERGKEKLRMAVEQNPDAVREVFTNADSGIAVRLNDIMDKAVNSSSLPEKRGSLVRIAGTDVSTGNNSSNLGSRIDTIDKALATLRTRLETEYNRYWKKFSSLETALARLNSQSSMWQQ